MFRLGILSILIALLFTNCNQPLTSNSTELQYNVVAQGPFFAGPNSFVVTVNPDLKQLMGDNFAEGQVIKKVTINNLQVSFNPSDSVSMEMVNSISLQIVGSDLPMVSIATLNPINSNELGVSLSSSSEVEIQDYFNQPSFTIVADVDFKEDLYLDELGMKLEVTADFYSSNN